MRLMRGLSGSTKGRVSTLRILLILLLGVLALARPVAATAQWDAKSAAIGGAALVGIGLLDAQILDITTQWNTPEMYRWLTALDYMGRGQEIVPVLGGSVLSAYALGLNEAGHSLTRITGGYGLTCIVVLGVKRVLGRNRPAETDDPYRFHLFELHERSWHSFPSGHTAQLFALAAGISEEAGHPLVTGAVCAVATAGAVERTIRAEHWPSDVVAGALIGHVAGKYATRALKRHVDWDKVPTLWLAPSAGGVEMGIELRR